MAQFYTVIRNVDELKQLNLENCVLMNEDGTPFNSQSVMLSEPIQVIDNNQAPQIIYQSNPRPKQMQTIQTSNGQMHYIVQEDDLQSDNFNIVTQNTPQIYYSKIENGTPIVQQNVKTQPEIQTTIETHQAAPAQFQTNASPQIQTSPYQQIIINYPQSQQVLVQQQQPPHQPAQQVTNLGNVTVRQAPQMQSTAYVFQPQQITSPPLIQVQQVGTPIQHPQQPQLTSPQALQEIQPPRIQLQTPQQIIRKIIPTEVVRTRAPTRLQNHVNMDSPQKIMQPAGLMQANIRAQPPLRARAPVTIVRGTVRPRQSVPRQTRPVNTMIPNVPNTQDALSFLKMATYKSL